MSIYWLGNIFSLAPGRGGMLKSDPRVGGVYSSDPLIEAGNNRRKVLEMTSLSCYAVVMLVSAMDKMATGSECDHGRFCNWLTRKVANQREMLRYLYFRDKTLVVARIVQHQVIYLTRSDGPSIIRSSCSRPGRGLIDFPDIDLVSGGFFLPTQT